MASSAAGSSSSAAGSSSAAAGSSSAAAGSSSAAATLPAGDLPGIVAGHKTFGWGRERQLRYDFDHQKKSHKLCTCYKKGKASGGRTAESMHGAGCEHGIILEAKRLHGYGRNGKKL